MKSNQTSIRQTRRRRSANAGTRLAERRRVQRRRRAGIASIFVVFIFVLIVIGLWQPSVRVNKITITTGETSLIPLVKTAISGTYAYLVPHDSIFFLAKSNIQHTIISTHPSIATVSISRTEFDSISITPHLRIPFAVWCGGVASGTPANTLSLDTVPSTDGKCYLFDGTGFLFKSIANYSVSTTSLRIFNATSTPLVQYVVYAPLKSTGLSPIKNTVVHARDLSDIFDFARQIHTLSASVKFVVVRGSEVDLFLKSGTRITYVLGNEQEAFSLLYATKNKISISDGSLLYVDLRFHGKVYFKKTHNKIKSA